MQAKDVGSLGEGMKQQWGWTDSRNMKKVRSIEDGGGLAVSGEVGQSQR